MTARVISMAELNRALYRYLGASAPEGADTSPLLISRHGKIVGALLRDELWEQVREDATARLDIQQVDEFVDRVATMPAEKVALGELFPTGSLPEFLEKVEVRALAYLRSDLRAAARAAKDLRNLAGFTAHLVRGYLQGSKFSSAAGETFFREVAPAYWEGQVPFRLVWQVPEGEQEPVLVAAVALTGVAANSWEYPEYMDATEIGTAEVVEEQA
ncbi:hypothetical protein ACUH95_00545 [Dermabacteraceae bacterium P13101]